MDVVVGLVIPYMLLFLLWIEEHAAILLLALFVVPLLDAFFYLQTPQKCSIQNYWTKLCVWMWFPCMFQVIVNIPPSSLTITSLCSVGLLYGTTVHASKALMDQPCWYEKTMALVMDDFLMRSYSFRSVIFLLFLNDKLVCHLVGCLIGNILYEWMNSMDNYQWTLMPCSSYGFGNFMFFRFQEEEEVVPASYMWLPLLWVAEKFAENIN